MTLHGPAFDLSSRLDLIPGQETQFEYDDDVPIDHIVDRQSCYCDRISRYGLVFLVSRHHQDITIGKKMPESIDSIIMETILGRFTCYTHANRNFVDFDPTVYSSDVPLVPDQNMDEIILGARGYYLINDTAQNKKFRWRNCSNDSLEYLASGNFFGVPNAVIYMPKAIMKKWQRLERFSQALQDAMNSALEGLYEPADFVLSLWNLPEDYRSSFRDSGISMRTTTERLAACVHLYRALSTKELIEMDFDSKFLLFTKILSNNRLLGFHTFALMNMEDLTEAHQYYRGPAVESWKLFQTSQDRFMRLLRKYKKAENAGRNLVDAILRDGLLGLLHYNPNNISLIVYQGFLATVARWNCCRVLSRAREVPEEWIKFVIADDDDDIYMGFGFSWCVLSSFFPYVPKKLTRV